MQGVLVFASAAARDAAITSPQEGQCCYLKDTDAVLTYSGAAWVGFDDSNAIQNSIVDAKGDLVAASGADTPARLAVGNNGETLVADSAATTGLRYSATPSASNPVLNSAMQVWQRGTSISLAASTSYTSGFTADRWQTQTAANQACTISRQATGDTTNLPNIQYALRHQRNSGQTGTNTLTLLQNVETLNSIPFAGKTVTLSFYARAGANFSAASSLLTPYIQYGTGTDQNIFSGFTGQTTAVTGSATLTTTWQRFSYSGTIPATATQIATFFNHTPVGTAGAADYYDITGVQIDIGSVALPYRTYAATIQGELAACQRYYEKSFTQATTPANGNSYNYGLTGSAYATGTAFTQWNSFQVIKRTTSSTITFYRNSDIATNGQWGYFSSGWATPTTTTANITNDRGFQVSLNKTSGFTLNAGLIIAGEWTAEAEL
jgi:hypothetical protein